MYFYLLKYTININVICQKVNYIYCLAIILSNGIISTYRFLLITEELLECIYAYRHICVTNLSTQLKNYNKGTVIGDIDHVFSSLPIWTGYIFQYISNIYFPMLLNISQREAYTYVSNCEYYTYIFKDTVSETCTHFYYSNT
ncbi:uncharacterized protein LOC124427566 [Vespa crabro]|uniref:uncharacterized protein LOC124427566 n=1 Tax=Vespa crabro TaxID=7445 RepID=UPI001F0132EB|nr:uncharacterized protein LOC124427566 [Vespa crabro]